MLKKKSFCIVCIANYCRSPVVEVMLNSKYKEKYEFFSAGISPIFQPGMDPRSLKFLNSLNISSKIHTPKNLNKKIFEYFDYFLAVDLFVLNELNTRHKKYRNKFRLLTSQFNNIDIIDPYKFDDENYIEVMKDIAKVVECINLENI